MNTEEIKEEVKGAALSALPFVYCMVIALVLMVIAVIDLLGIVDLSLLELCLAFLFVWCLGILGITYIIFVIQERRKIRFDLKEKVKAQEEAKNTAQNATETPQTSEIHGEAILHQDNEKHAC